MKSLKQHITEKLIVNKNYENPDFKNFVYNITDKYNCTCKRKDFIEKISNTVFTRKDYWYGCDEIDYIKNLSKSYKSFLYIQQYFTMSDDEYDSILEKIKKLTTFGEIKLLYDWETKYPDVSKDFAKTGKNMPSEQLVQITSKEYSKKGKECIFFVSGYKIYDNGNINFDHKTHKPRIGIMHNFKK